MYTCKRYLLIFELHSTATGVFKLVPLEERSAETDFSSIQLQDQVKTGVKKV